MKRKGAGGIIPPARVFGENLMGHDSGKWEEYQDRWMGGEVLYGHKKRYSLDLALLEQQKDGRGNSVKN